MKEKSKFFLFNTFVGNFLDIETIGALKLFSSKIGSCNFTSLVNNTNVDFREYYSFNMSLDGVSKTDLCLLVNTNLRIELPLLHLRLRNAFLKGGSLIYLVGYHSNFNFYVKHLGISNIILLRILEGVHWLCAKFTKEVSRYPSIFISSSFLKNGHDAFFSNLSSILNKFSNFNRECWLGISIINTNISDFSSLELNVFSSLHNQNIFYSKNSFSYLVGFDSFAFPKDTKNIIIYQGHHGDVGANVANIILPSTVFVEKTSSYFNFLGDVQAVKKSIFGIANSRDD